MPVKITVEHQTLCFNTDAIGIGRDPENQVALPNDTRLAPLHAIMRCVNGRWIIESRDGGPVRIGNGRPARFAWLNSGDVISLSDTGPELVFEPLSVGTSDAASSSPTPNAADPVKVPASVPVNAPYIPFIPDKTGNRDSVLARDRDTVAAHLGPHASAPPPVVKPSAPPEVKSLSRVAPFVAVAAASMVIVAVAAWAMIGRGAKPTEVPKPDIDVANRSLNTASNTEAKAPEPVTKLPSPTIPAEVDPQEFLVLIGIGDLKTDSRPHVFGVGWLWDERTAVSSRQIGTAIKELVEETQLKGVPRQGCVIQGLACEVGEIRFPEACPEVSILQLKQPARLPRSAREQWKSVAANDIEYLRSHRKSLAYYSYEPLPRPTLDRQGHDFPLCEYDPETCQPQNSKPRFLFEQGIHYLKPADNEVRLELGGLLVDEDRKILGMALPDSSLIWTSKLDRALGSR